MNPVASTNVVKHVLPNGVRVVLESIPTVRSAAVGLWCRTGSVDETTAEAGITHLIEHMLFKGTEKRTAKEIAETIEGRGGSLNAFTDKENTCYYCRVLSEEVPTAIDLLADMVRHSRIEREELKREESVVLEEIKRSHDEPGDHVHDLHLEARWPSSPLGKPVIGTPESVASFEPDHLRGYLDRRYRGDNLVLAVTGQFDERVVLELAEMLLGDLPGGGDKTPLERPSGISVRNEIADDVEQVHFVIGTDSPGAHDDDREAMVLLDAGLGGSMSSRIFQEVREKRGLAYSIGSYSLTYSVGGAFGVYGGTGAETWREVESLVREEMRKVREDGLTPEELERTKLMIRGSLLMSMESTNSRMMRLGRQEMTYGRAIPPEEILARYDAVTGDDIRRVAQGRLDPETINVTAIGPEEAFAAPV